MAIRATIQLCTYNRAHLLGRVLDACFEQTSPSEQYEVVLVDDGSVDDTAAVIETAKARATCAFTVVRQPNAGLARARNAGIARASGARIIFIDDDTLPIPSFVAEHLRSHDLAPHAIVRGAVINTQSFERLPLPVWTPLNYSGNYFWTSNVSLPLAKVRALGGFTESFREYGWEDIELGLRLRFAGTRSIFNKKALVFHYKPRPSAANVDGMVRQARAQARTAAQLRALHPHWRVVLATGDDPVHRVLHRIARVVGVPHLLAGIVGVPHLLAGIVGERSTDRQLSARALFAARALAREAYYEELDSARRP